MFLQKFKRKEAVNSAVIYHFSGNPELCLFQKFLPNFEASTFAGWLRTNM